MELLLEIIMDLLLDGSFEIVTEKKVPMVLRVIAGMILAVVYGGLAYLGVMLMLSGFASADVPLILCGVILASLIVILGIGFARKWHNRD